MAKRRENVYAVLRVDLWDDVTVARLRDAPDHYFTVRELVPTQEEAEREVERLTALNVDKNCVYFAQITRLFPDGRDVQVGY